MASESLEPSRVLNLPSLEPTKSCAKIVTMQIACPNCSTIYQIAATAIGASGRSVRCVRCQSVWFVPSPGAIPAVAEHAVSGAESPADDNTEAPPQEMPSAVSEDHMAGFAE